MRKRQRTSIVWQISKEELEKIVKKSKSLAEIIKHFGLVIASGNYKTLKKRLNEENIDYSHIKLGLNSNKGRKFREKAFPLKEVMVKNSTYSRYNLKRRLLKNNMLENKCSICGLEPEWNSQKLVMILDHINGVNNDHRLENLRLLCPNCNSQTDTFAGKRLKKRYNCSICRKTITKYSTICKKCSEMKQRQIQNRPSKEQLLKEIEETNYCAVGRKYGVSDNTIRKWLK